MFPRNRYEWAWLGVKAACIVGMVLVLWLLVSGKLSAVMRELAGT